VAPSSCLTVDLAKQFDFDLQLNNVFLELLEVGLRSSEL
jgi:hypothetical protein